MKSGYFIKSVWQHFETRILVKKKNIFNLSLNNSVLDNTKK